jgi:acyl-CoA reductase-like NAD-dependent aldehyde dehydrogenase
VTVADATSAVRSETTSDQLLDVENPYTGEIVGRVPICGPIEVDHACQTAKAVLLRNDFPLYQRARVLDQAARLLGERAEQFARTISLEAGKPIKAARVEVARCIETLKLSAAEARKLGGEVLPAEASASGQGRLMFTVPVPIGVVGAITPFNFPLNLVAHKIAPAIAAGCPVVLKPAPQAPLSGIALVDLLVEAGLPSDWITVVTDAGSEAGSALVQHPVPALITFTGSVGVGWGIAAAAPKKRVALELGSTAPMIVEPGVDLETVAAEAAAAGFGYAGQSCISLQRVIVHRSIHTELRDALAAAAERLVLGDPADHNTDVGPMIEAKHTSRVQRWIEESLVSGAKLIAGGEVIHGVLQPTVVDAPPLHSRLWREEIFGPVIALRPYDDIEEAFALANDTDLAIHAAIWTNDLSTAMRAVRTLDFAGVIVNGVPTLRVDSQPYGGVREAGNTREGPAYAVREMTEFRCVSLPIS